VSSGLADSSLSAFKSCSRQRRQRQPPVWGGERRGGSSAHQQFPSGWQVIGELQRAQRVSTEWIIALRETDWKRVQREAPRERVNQRCDECAAAPVAAAEVSAAEVDAGAGASELVLLLADGSDAGFGVAAGADVAGALPLGEAEQHDFPCVGVGCFGAETPAMPDPRPSFCRLVASSLPLGSRPFAD